MLYLQLMTYYPQDLAQVSIVATAATYCALKDIMPAIVLNTYIKTKLSLDGLVAERGVYYLVKDIMSDNVLGYVHLILNSNKFNETIEIPDKYTLLNRLYLLPDDTGRGYGVEVLKLIREKVYEEMGQKGMYLSAYVLNKRAHKFYQREGFEYKGEVVFHAGEDYYNKDYLFMEAKPHG